MEFRLLGPLEASERGRPVPLGGPKQRAVLAHLLIRANQVVSSDRLIDEIWGDEPPEAARNSLQSYVSRLRHALADPGRIEGRPPGYVLGVDPDELDALRFEALVDEGRRSLADEPSAALARFEEALALWRGPALADLADEPSLQGEIARLEEQRLAAIEDRIAAELAVGRHGEVVGELAALVERYPLRERLWGHLMLSLYRSGRQAEALEAFQRARRLLAEELGIDPSGELRQLQGRILRQDPSLDLEGKKLRGYRLLEQIGEGRLGVVYHAIQPHVGREVAIKVIPQTLANDPDFIRRFETEAQIVAGLEHPHIVPLYDYWREPDAAYLVMRWLRGGSLQRVLADGPLEIEATARMLDQVAAALAAAHREGVAHGAVKPANILLDEDGNAYLTDFGIASNLSPEQIRREPSPTRTDIYSLGLVLSEALAGSEVAPGIDAVIRRATANVPAERYEDAPSLAAAFREAIGASRAPAVGVEMRNPYKGLRAFQEADAGDFFGREGLVERVAARLTGDGPASRLLALVGASGSGKSSVVRAGLIPALRQGAVPGSSAWFVVEMFPGSHPLEELEAALLRVAVNPPPSLIEQLERDEFGILRAVKRSLPAGEPELLLLVDQFEELFTLVEDEKQRMHFIRSLVEAVTDPRSRLRLVIALRADFYDRPLEYQGFAELLRAGIETLVPLSPQDLERAITRPAEQVGATCEPGLVAQMFADVAGEPGALPLLQYALTELFGRRQDHALTLQSYREIGGISGAVAARAEELYEAASDAGREAAQQLFLRLVTLGEGTEETRRRVARAELDSLEVDQAALEQVIDAFGGHRLLSFDRDPHTRAPTVEVAHEALLRAWGRLRGWIEAAREDLRLHRRLAAETREWESSGREASFLLRGTRLDLFEPSETTSGLALARAEREYLEASLAQRDVERAHEEARKARERALERRSVSRLRALVAVLAVAALVAAGLTLFAFDQREEARDEARVSFARELASAALANLDEDPERSILLALEAVNATGSGGTVLREAEEALHAAVQSSRVVRSLPGSAVRDRGMFVSVSPDGSRLASIGDDGKAAVWDLASGDKLFSLEDRVMSVAFSSDASRLATGGEERIAKLWNAATGKELMAFSGSGRGVVGIAFSRDGTRLATSALAGLVKVWSTETGRRLAAVAAGAATGLAFNANGTLLITTDTTAATVWDLSTQRALRRLDAPAFNVAVSPDGSLAALVGLNGLTGLWNPVTGEQLRSLSGHRGHVGSVEFSADGRTFATGGDDGTVRVWDAKTGTELIVLAGQGSAVGTVALDRDGTRVAACCGGGRAMVWDTTPQGSRELLTLAGHQKIVMRLAFSSDGRRLATASEDGTARVWDAASGKRLLALTTHHAPVADIAFSPDGKRLATAGFDRTARIWDAATGRGLHVLRGHAAPVWGLSFSPDGRRLATVGEDTTGRIWDAATGKELMRLRSHTDAVWKVSYSPDGSRLATVSNDAVPRVWDAASGRVLAALKGHSGNVVELGFSPDGERVATAGIDGTARVWDVATGDEVLGLAGHAGAVLDVEFSPDGGRLATASLDGTAKLWEARTGRELLSLTAPGGEAGRLAFSPDGTRLAVAEAAGVVRIYVLPIEDLVRLARERVTRGLTDAECRQYLHRERCPAP